MAAIVKIFSETYCNVKYFAVFYTHRSETNQPTQENEMSAKTYECYLINDGELMAKTSGHWRAQGSTVLLRSESGVGGRWKCRISYAAKWAKEAEIQPRKIPRPLGESKND